MNQREIKFRVWDKFCEHMDYPGKKTGLVIGLDGRILSPIMDMKGVTIGQFYDYKDDFILMQFTGLKGKCSKEIYDGDIVEYKVKKHSKKAKYEVLWCEFGKWTLERLDSDGYASVGFVEWKKCKIIGSIYENQELLVEKKNEQMQDVQTENNKE